MSPEVLMFLISTAISQGPKIGRAAKALFVAKGDPTSGEWEVFFGAIEEKQYDEYTVAKALNPPVGKVKPTFNPTIGD